LNVQHRFAVPAIACALSLAFTEFVLPSALAAQDCPTIAALRNYKPAEATRVFALDGSKLADLSQERRVVVTLDKVPKTVWNGFVAVEDRRFWQHDGVDVRGIGRAILKDITSLSLKEGFSTIPMQLARNVFPTELPRSDKMHRKMCEVKLASAIEAAFPKRDVLQMYVNQVYMGDGLYGVEAAARGYFGKPVANVTVAEAALLVGLVKNPEGYNPRKNPARAIQRRDIVLGVMAREKVITAAEAAKAKTENIRLIPPIEAAGSAPYFVAAVRRELRDRFGDSADVKGLRVFTGLDPDIQRTSQREMLKQIKSIEKGTFGKYRHPVPPAGPMAAASGGSSPYLQGMIIVLDARNGEIRALVGGRDFTHSSYDRALLARRQPGSTFKPIVYAAALEAGLSPSARIETTPVTVANVGAVAWKPDDLVPDSVTSLTVREALALSSNNGTVRVGEFATATKVVDMAKRLGLTTPIPAYPSIFLGSAEVIPIEFAAAYATIGNGGMRVKPHLITRVEDAHGKVLWRAAGAEGQVIAPAISFITTSMLQDVIDHGTGVAVRRNGFWLPAAGKTGTTNGAKDVWFMGMTPDLVGAVWFGFDKPKEILPNAFGGNLAAPVWAGIMKAAYATRPAPAPWVAPLDLVQVPIDIQSGMVATQNCPPDKVRIEYYTEGTAPTEYCPLHPAGLVARVMSRVGDVFRGRL
jgi:penicillin-binding protein 1A